MDIRMPRLDGVQATELVRARSGAPDVIVLTTFDADDHVIGALRAGASGFLLKDTAPADIVDAVRRVAAGEPILSAAIMRHWRQAIWAGIVPESGTIPAQTRFPPSWRDGARVASPAKLQVQSEAAKPLMSRIVAWCTSGRAAAKIMSPAWHVPLTVRLTTGTPASRSLRA